MYTGLSGASRRLDLPFELGVRREVVSRKGGYDLGVCLPHSMPIAASSVSSCALLCFDLGNMPGSHTVLLTNTSGGVTVWLWEKKGDGDML